MPTTDDWSTTPASNATTSGKNIAEGCAAGNLNDWGREIMAQVKAKFDLVDAAVTAAGTLTAALSAISALTPAADKLPYYTSASAAALASITAYGRTLTGLADVAALMALIIPAKSLASPGYVKFANGFHILWGSKAFTGHGASESINYTTEMGVTITLTTFSLAVLSAGSVSDTQANGPFVTSCSTSGFNFSSSAGANASTLFWIAVGV